MSQENAAGAFANRPAWFDADPNEDPAFAYSVGPTRQTRIEKALSALGHQDPASIRALVDYDGALKESCKDNWEGRYLVTLQNEDKIVCHAKSFISVDTYVLSHAVYKHIRVTEDLFAPELLPSTDGKFVQRMDDMFVAFTTFVPGRPVDPNRGDMRDAAYGVSIFKRAIESLPEKIVSAIVKNGKAISERTLEGIDFMLSDNGQGAMAKCFDSDERKILTGIAHIFREESAKGVMPCHGDLVPGNYYMGEQQTPLFLDFDNVGGSMFPADVDIGTVLHRIGIEKNKDQSVDALRSVFADVLDGYNASEYDEMTPERLVRSMKVAVGWKLCGSFAELAAGVDSYMGAEVKVWRFSTKALEINALSQQLAHF